MNTRNAVALAITVLFASVIGTLLTIPSRPHLVLLDPRICVLFVSALSLFGVLGWFLYAAEYFRKRSEESQ